MNIFDRIINFMDRTEVSFVTLLAKIIPLLVPIIPAYVGYKHVTNTETGLGFDPLFGWVYGAVIEGLGYAAIYKAVQFWENNRKETREENQAPLFGAIIIYIVYLIVTLAVNVMLDLKAGVASHKVWALGLISLLSVPAGLLMSISAVHTERKTERERLKSEAAAERKAERERRREEERITNEHRTPQPERRPKNERPVRTPSARTIPQPANEQGGEGNEHPLGFPTNEQAAGERVIQYISMIERTQNRTPGQSEIARAVNVSKSTADKWLKDRPL